MRQARKEPVLGLFQDPEGVAQAVERLHRMGITSYDILSGTPYPEGTFGEPEPRHRLYVFPLIGAMCGFTAGLLLTTATQLAYPLVTGGKPLLSIPAMFIPMYEGTLLGAILFTVLGVLFESRLPLLAPSLYDPRITEGLIGLEVVVEPGQREAVKRALQESGALDIKEWTGVRRG